MFSFCERFHYEQTDRTPGEQRGDGGGWGESVNASRNVGLIGQMYKRVEETLLL